MFVVVEVSGTDVANPTLVGVVPGKDLRVFGTFDTPQMADEWIESLSDEKEKFVILALEWHRETI